MMKVAAWVLGEFAETLSQDQQSRVMTILCKALHWRFEDALTKGWILTALQKLGHGVPSDDVREMVSKFSSSRNEDLQQRCYEFAGVCTKLTYPISFKENLNKQLDLNLNFLDDFVRQKLMDGARPYDPERNRRGLAYMISKSKTEDHKSDVFQGMRTEAYDAPRVEAGRPYMVSTPASGPEPRLEKELKVPTQVWTKEGYMGKQSVQEPNRPAPIIGNQPVISPPGPRAAPPKPKSQKELDKERLAQSLFGGFGGEPAPAQPQPPRQDSRPVQQPPRRGNDLLDF